MFMVLYIPIAFFKTNSSAYENMISNIEINTQKRPAYFISVSLFNSQNTTYNVIKKVL